MSHLPQYWMDGAVRTLEGVRRGLSEPFPLSEDPPSTTPYEVVYEGGKVRLRHYRAVGEPHTTPLLVVYSLIKRPLILDLQPGGGLAQGTGWRASALVSLAKRQKRHCPGQKASPQGFSSLSEDRKTSTPRRLFRPPRSLAGAILVIALGKGRHRSPSLRPLSNR